MDDILDELDLAGFPLRRLTMYPSILAYGPSQSGKSTILHLLSMVRLARGIPVTYCTTPSDLDFPPLAFTKVRGLTTTDLRQWYTQAAGTIHRSDKNITLQSSFVWDEAWKAKQDYDVDTSILVKEILQKGPKTGILNSIITQNRTLEALGLKGCDKSIQNAFKFELIASRRTCYL
jgi:hypothetical protein